MSGNIIHHLVPAAEFAAVPAGEPYLPTGFAADGFIHCTGELDTLLDIANQFYRTTAGDFLVLVIDPSRLTAPLRWEPPLPAPAPDRLVGRLFPHIYGPLNPQAIIAIRQAQRAPDGTFLTL